ncbi:radical SAM family heme chaperone HemW [bacterium]|nr:radical SAM family heme chaperone HemW [bacterium]
MDYPKSAYIHIPFCHSRCKYCGFATTVNLKKELGYVIALLKDIDVNYKKNPLNTVYFGGGTPSVLPVEHVKKIFNKFILNDNAEITFELNPENATKEYLEGLFDIGINRLSIGCQTFDSQILSNIGRIHSVEDSISAVKMAKNAGFKNVSIDLIYGLPNQTLELFKKDLELVKNLDIQHVSLYGLKIEDNSIYGKCIPENLPDDDSQADMYLLAIDELNTFKHYEISNFAISEEFQSKHNLTYWANKEYYGFGSAAHGYENNIRYANAFNVNSYIENPLIRDYGHTLTEKEKLEEEIFLGFRVAKGINVENINSKFNIDFESKYANTIKKYLNTQHILKTNTGYALSNNGFLISNVILSEFI